MHAVQSSCTLESENLLLIWPLKSIEMVLVLYTLIYRNTKLIFDTSLNITVLSFLSFFFVLVNRLKNSSKMVEPLRKFTCRMKSLIV